MIIEKQSGHIAFQLEQDEAVFELGYKVLMKQQIHHTLSGIRVQYNLKDRMMYDIENLQTISDSYASLTPEMALQIMISMLQVIKEVDNNGFILLEALQISENCIFWNQDEKKAYFIVLPVGKEFETNDHRSWVKKLRDTIQKLAEKLDMRISEMVMQCLGSNGRLVEQTNALLQMLEQEQSLMQPTVRSAVPETQMTLYLVHNGMYGQIILCDQKKEYIIGKKKDSVDGYLGISNAVSRIHCKVIRRQNQFFISDLGSSNHTYVNSIMLYPQQEKELFDGARVRIADIDFIVRIA